MEDEGEILCQSGELTSSCKLTVKKGESKPQIECPDEFNGPAGHPFVIEVPYKSKFIIATINLAYKIDLFIYIS